MTRFAFYDLDGTLCSSNVVERYAFFARHQPSRARAVVKCGKLLMSVPVLIGLDFYSRALFNQIFYREYRGLRQDWLRELDERLFERVIRPSIYPGAKEMVEADRTAGFRPVLVTGELDVALTPVARHFGFDAVISNSLVYQDGTATGEVIPPLIAEAEKVEAMKRLCAESGADLAESKAYSDSFSDAPMLESVGYPVAVNPDRRLRKVAVERGWPVVELKKGTLKRGTNGHPH